SAALGPTLGGAIILFADWQGIFLVNILFASVGIVLALRFLPSDPPRSVIEDTGTVRKRGTLPIDIGGILLFGGTLTSLLVFLLSLSDRVQWLYLPIAVTLCLLFVVRERRARDPFIDLSMFTAGSLRRVYASFASVNTVFYSLFFGLPLWLEQARGLAPDAAGLLMLPFAGLGVIATPVAARLIRTRSVKLVILVGMATMVAATLLLLLLDGNTTIAAIVAITVVLGIPNAFNNMGLQAALFQAAPAQKIGAASGLFQTSRYVGTFMSSALLGIAFGSRATSRELHLLALILAAISIILLAASARNNSRQ
ncbi:MAG TPA: MFS transporter, partial [Spirochaetia bacterium]|nr:MFS transporter [Spirochaetia bacterium]